MSYGVHNLLARLFHRRPRASNANGPHYGLSGRRLGTEFLEQRTLLSISPWPELPGLHLADPAQQSLQSQTVYLDFNGAKGVDYNGPVAVKNIDVPAFKAPGDLAGQEKLIAARVLEHVQEVFSGVGVIFTIDAPRTGVPYSVIYVGGDSSAFASYGIFSGLAEQVDVGNANPHDNAFVFTNALSATDLDSYVADLSAVVNHEAGHLLGYVHKYTSDVGGPLSEVADTGTKTGSNSSDATYTTANTWVWTGISISGAPSNAVISSVTVTWNVDSNYTSDIDWYVENFGYWNSSTYTDMAKTGDDWFDGYSETSDGSRTVYPSSSTPVNGTWYFNIRDSYNDSNPDWNKGRIDSWSITINYTYSNPPGAPSTPDLAAADDTGVSNSDNITYQTTGLTFSWSAASGTVERYYYGWDTITPSSTYTTALSRDIDAPSGNGNHTFNVRGWNSGSGFGPASNLTVFIDRNRPSVTNLDLRQSDDMGKYYDDNVTNDTNVRFTWTGNANGGSGIYNYDYGWTSSGVVGYTSNNYVDISPPSNNGTYTFYVEVQAVSGLWGYYPTYSAQLPVTWDTIAPAPPTFSYPGEWATVGTVTPTLQWNSVSDAWKYQVYVREDGFPYLDSRTSPETTATQWTVSPALSEKNWGWQVQVWDTAGNPSGFGRNGTVGSWGHFTVQLPNVTSVRWEDSAGNLLSGPVNEGTTAYLALYATGFSTGQVFSADIIEGGVYSNGEQVSNLPVNYYSSGKWRASWTTFWLKDAYDIIGGNYDPEYYFRLDTYGNTSGDLRVRDATPPGAPTFDSANSSHQPNVWSGSNDPDIWWNEPTDGSGIAGYSVLINNSSSGTPDTTVDTTSRHYSITDTADTSGLWFHVRAQDNSGNWATSIAHFGPFKIDATKPTMPSSPLIQPVGDTTVYTATPLLDWKDGSDNLSGIAQYEVWVGSDILGVTKLDKAGLSSSQYTPTSGEALPEERLKWSVRVQDNAGNWSDWTNTTYGYQYFTVHLRPDLVVQDIAINGQTDLSPVTIRQADSVTIDALSKNVGGGSTNPSVPYKWWWGYSSGDKYQQITDGNGNDVGGTIADVNGLQPNEEEWVSEVIIGGVDPDDWVVNLPTGTYWLTFEIDAPNQNDEGPNEGNNTRSESFTVLPTLQPDLDVLSVTGTQASYRVGDALWAEAVVENVGDATAYNARLDWYLGTASNGKYRLIEGDAWLGGVYPLNDMSPNEQDTDEINWGGWSIPADVPEGTYYVYAFARNDTGDSNPSNDWDRSASFTVSPPNNAPPEPGSVAVPLSDLNRTTARVTWQASVDPDGDSVSYGVEYRINDTSSWTSAGTTSATWMQLNGLTENKVYVVRVRALDSWGAPSQWVELDPAFRATMAPVVKYTNNTVVTSPSTSQETWVVFHGRGGMNWSSGDPIYDLATEVDALRAQVLVVDWTGLAAFDSNGDGNSTLDFGGEQWILPMAHWVADKLTSWGFVGTALNTLNFMGHSWGAVLEAETLALLTPMGQIDSVVALDPAEDATTLEGGTSYDTENANIDFRTHSDFSWAFYSRDGGVLGVTAGSETTAPRADLSFVVTNSEHTRLVSMFTNMLKNGADGVSTYFQLPHLLNDDAGPWRPDHYDDEGTRPIIETPYYEAVIDTTANGTMPLSIRYVNGSGVEVTEYETPTFMPYFSNASLSGLTDNDGDGKYPTLKVGFDVDANIAGQFYVTVNDYDTVTANDWIDTSSTYSVSGTASDWHYVTFSISSSWFEWSSLDTADIFLDLYDAATGVFLARRNLGTMGAEMPADDAALSVENLEIRGPAISGYGGLEVSFDLVNNTAYTITNYLPEVRISTDTNWDDSDLTLNWNPDPSSWNRQYGPGDRVRISNVIEMPATISIGEERHIQAAGVHYRSFTNDLGQVFWTPTGEHGNFGDQVVTVADLLSVIPAVTPKPGDILFKTGSLDWFRVQGLLNFYNADAVPQEPVGWSIDGLRNQLAQWMPGHVGLVTQVNSDGSIQVFESLDNGPEFHTYSRVELFGNRGDQYDLYMGARTVPGGLSSLPPDSWLNAADSAAYAYDSFMKLGDGMGLGWGPLSKGIAEFTCVGLTEAIYDAAGESIVSAADEQAWPIALSPYKQWLRTTPEREVNVAAGDRVEFSVLGIYHGAYIDSSGEATTGQLQADLCALPQKSGGIRQFAYDSSRDAKVFRWDVPTSALGDYQVVFNGSHGGTVGHETVTIHVTAAPEHAPVAINDAYSTDEDLVLNVPAPGVLSNDTDADGDPLTAVLVTGPSHGSLAFNKDTGLFSYRPSTNYFGADSFTYKAYDGIAWSNVATVTITVNPVNDRPVARNDAYTMDQNGAGNAVLTIAASGVLGNDTDVDSPTLSAVWVSDPGHGTLSLNTDGSFTYRPTGYTGTDSFTYKVNDGQAESNVATVVITVNPPAGAPPTVETVVINDGSAQRSMVTSMTVTFNTVVTIDDLAAAFQVVNRAGGNPVGLVENRNDVGGKTVVTLTFSGAGIIGGSLVDGNYLLTVSADHVFASGFRLDGNHDGTPNDDFTFGAAAVEKFFRFFGDQDGDRDVDATDRFRFLASRGKTAGQAGYLWYFDYDNDGDVDSLDVDQFNIRYALRNLGF